MNNWKDVQAKKSQMRQEAIADLSADEKAILMKALELEWENRHLKSPDVHRPLRNFIKQVIQ